MNEFETPPVHDHLVGYPQPCEVINLFGHDEQKEFLSRSYQSGKLHHALLFEGACGIGKASLAFMFARHILTYRDTQAAPVFKDGSSTAALIPQVLNNAHPQILYLTRPFDPKTSKYRTQLTVDEVRRIGSFIHHTSSDPNCYKIIIIDPVNDMNINAANALLKNLEEPTAQTLFILISHSSQKLLPTIRSRCLSVKFQPLNPQEMVEALSQLKRARISEDEMHALISKSNGSVREAIMLYDQGGLDVISAVDDILKAQHFDALAALKLAELVSSKDAEALFHLVCDYLLNDLAQKARDVAEYNLPRANRLCQLHDELVQKIATALEYNLEKRHLIVNIIMQIHKRVIE